MDPFYRTIKGFEVLIEKDWVSFGFKFSDRQGHFRQMDDEMSPIFLQFLEVVWQIWQQFPEQFEFNEKFLLTILEHSYACLVGNFLVNTDKQREEWKLHEKTLSLWTMINHDTLPYSNCCYDPNAVQQSLTQQSIFLSIDASPHVLALNCWRTVYFAGELNNKPAQQGASAMYRLQLENLRLRSELEAMKQNVQQQEQ